MSEETKFIESYREKFNEDVIYIVNILNKIFNEPLSLSNNYLNLESKDGGGIPESLNNLSYQSLKEKKSIEQERDLLDRVCSNISLIYTSPLQLSKTVQVNKDTVGIPLTQYMKQETGLPVGIRSDDLSEYVYDKDLKKILKREVGNVKNTVCETETVKELRKYFFYKLKLLVYLRSVLNLNDVDKLNVWEKIYQDALQNNYTGEKMENARRNLKTWYDYIQEIFTNVKDDSVEIQDLEKYIMAFENQDATTKELCETIIQVCDVNITIPNDRINNICNDKINIHSVTEDICPKDRLRVSKTQSVDLIRQLDQAIENVIPTEENKPLLENIRRTQSEIQIVQEDLNKKPPSKDTASQYDKLNIGLSGLIEDTVKILEPQRAKIISEEGPKPITTSGGQILDIIGGLLTTRDQGKPVKIPSRKDLKSLEPTIITQTPPVPQQIKLTEPMKRIVDEEEMIKPQIGKVVDFDERELIPSRNQIANILRGVFNKRTDDPRVKNVIRDAGDATKTYEQEYKIEPDKAERNFIRTMSQSLVKNQQTDDPKFKRYVAEVSKPKKQYACFGTSRLSDEIDDLILSIDDEEDKKLLNKIKVDFNKLVFESIKTITGKYNLK
jgi:hypothetical protein